MNRLLAIGFEPAGHWVVSGESLFFELTRHSTQRNILYAFVCDGDVKYVGKTTQTLRARMNGYKKPGQTQVTNIRNSARIRQLLSSGSVVDILALPDNGLLHYGQFHVNLAAGLEDDIIRLLKPEWNGAGSKHVLDESDTPVPSASVVETPIDSFRLVLHKTYYNHGFFNVGVDSSDRLGGHGELIEIYPGDSEKPILGVINRTANSNKSPRIFGSTELRAWFQREMTEMQEASVSILSQNAIRIRPKVAS